MKPEFKVTKNKQYFRNKVLVEVLITLSSTTLYKVELKELRDCMSALSKKLGSRQSMKNALAKYVDYKLNKDYL